MKFPRVLPACVAVSACFGAGKAMAVADAAYAHANENASFKRGDSGTGAGSTARLDLLGAVASNCTIAISATAKAGSLDLKGGETEAVVGMVTENCSSKQGYIVSITSQNGGQLRSGGASAPLVNYSARYDDATGSLAVSGLTATRTSANFNRQRGLIVSLAAHAQAIAGSYFDSITFVIAAK